MQGVGLPVLGQYDHIGVVRVGLAGVTNTREQGPSVCALGIEHDGVGRAGDQAHLTAQVNVPRQASRLDIRTARSIDNIQRVPAPSVLGVKPTVR